MTELTIDARLDALPNRVGIPFQGAEPNRTLGFAIGFQYLVLHGTPVGDVITMAKRQQRQINLDWSAKRWKQEHDRLARAETLERLTTENVTYDLSKYMALLPERFDGYLIRNSRRLGMEGLRQRHCVASYHGRISAGNCAIAAIFIDKTRWTVQLAVNSGADGDCLQVVAVKSRYNQQGGRTVWKQVHEMLDLAVDSTASELGAIGGEQEEERHYLDTLRAVLPLLRAAGISSVTVEFNGSGDSGTIEDCLYYHRVDGVETYINSRNDDAFDSKSIQVAVNARRIHWNQITRRFEPVDVGYSTLDEAINALAEDYIDSTDVDWYNNDGGYGNLEIDVVEGTVSLEVYSRYTETSVEYDERLDINTGDVID